MARAAERIAAGAVGGGEESVLFTPGGSRLWQDHGGMGKEAGDEDVMAEVHACCALCVVCAHRQRGLGRRRYGRGSCVLCVVCAYRQGGE